MLILHACLVEPGSVRVWGEDSAAAREVRPARGRPAKAPRVKPHPFAASLEQVVAAVAASSIPAPAISVDDQEIVLQLPTGKRGPAPSTGAAESAAGSEYDKMWLAPWSVPALQVNLGSAAADLVLGTEPGVGDRLGDSWRWLAKLARFSLEAVAAGRVVPDLIERPVEAGVQPTEHPQAANEGADQAWRDPDPAPQPESVTLLSWRPILSPVDLSRLRRLAETVPPSARTGSLLALPGDDEPRTVSLGDRVEVGFLVLTDALVRRGVRDAVPPPGNNVRSWLVRSLAAPELEYLDVGAAPIRSRALLELSDWVRFLRPVDDSIRICFRLDPPSTLEAPDVGPDADTGAGAGLDELHSAPAADATDADAGPEADADQWRVEILLQSTEDPSLIVPMSDVWQSGGEATDTFAGTETQVLESLGRASHHYRELDAALQSAAPSGLDLTTQGAVDFLTGAAAELEAAGFGVLVPQTLRGTPRARVQPRRGTPMVGEAVPSGFGLDEMVQFDLRLALGDQDVDVAELAQLAELKVPLVRLRGQWVHVEPDEIADLVAAIERQARAGGPQASVRDLIHAGLGLADLDIDVAVEVGGDDAWLRDLVAGSLGLDVSDYQSIPTPAGIDGVLRDYQERGLGWLSFMDRLGLGACLADDMGLGKTIQLLSLLVIEREAAIERGTAIQHGVVNVHAGGESGADGISDGSTVDAAPAPTLLVAPMSLVGNWQKEAARFAPNLSVHIHHGSERARDDFVEQVAGSDIVLTTYAIAARDRDVLARVRWGRIVLDEAQNIKNARTKASVALRALDAGTRIALTGTPVENRLSELWSILDFCNPGLLGPAKTFHDRFAIPIERYQDAEATRLLSEVVGPFILRRSKTDPEIAAGLPDKTEIKAYCTLTREQASLYQATVDDMLARIEESEGIERRGLVLSMMLRLKQVCNHPAQLLADNSAVAGRSGKLAHLEETLTEVLAVGEKALIFTQFVAMGEMLTSHLASRFGSEVLFLHGGVSRVARDAMVQSFDSENGPPIFVLSLKAGGTGLNLTAANHVVHFDRWWNPAVEDQASDRAFRIGQTRNVQVRKLICSGTLEERIDEMIDRKKALAGSVISSGEGWLTELSTAELADVIALGRDAVMEA